jgi:hypothetical protein
VSAAFKRIMAEDGQQGSVSSATATQFADVPGVRTVALEERLKQHSRTKITPVHSVRRRQILCKPARPQPELGCSVGQGLTRVPVYHDRAAEAEDPPAHQQ